MRHLKLWVFFFGCALSATGILHPVSTLAQSPVLSCNVPAGSPVPAWCKAVRGDRPSGWLGQGRSEVMAQHGIVATSQPLAAQAGLRVLMAGGNAIDAAVATAAVLNLVEPMNVGLAGDLFAIIYIAKEKKIYQLNASGMAPSGGSVENYNKVGYSWDPNNWGFGSGMPSGILSVTVPGSIWGWDEVLKKLGTMTFKEVLQPAIDYAEQGFPISEVIGNSWILPAAVNCRPGTGCSDRDPDAVSTWYINGQPPKPGQIFKNPELARTFRLLQQYGGDVFYKGEIAKAIVAKVESLKKDYASLDTYMTLEDLASYNGEWVMPAMSTYQGYDIYETMAPSQAWNTLEMLNILEQCIPTWVPGKTLADLGPTDPRYWHLLVEAKKVAYEDLYAVNSDPNFWSADVKALFPRLLTKEYARSLCKKVDPTRASTPKPRSAGPADTIYLTTADRWGNMVSWVNSNYSAFGSGIGVPGYGFVLHNRGRQFTMDPKSPNRIEPHKRPYNTISAGFLLKKDPKGEPATMMTFGLMGGDMQVQGHAQMLVNILSLGANLQASTDMARFYHNEVPNTLALESQLYNVVGSELKAMGHNVISTNGAPLGGYQAILFTRDPAAPVPEGSGGWPASGVRNLLGNDRAVNGFYRGGSDHRKDGGAVGW